MKNGSEEIVGKTITGVILKQAKIPVTRLSLSAHIINIRDL